MEGFVRENRRAGRCALCHDRLEEASRLAACDACGSIVHDECRQELGRCPTLGCSGALASEQASVVAPLPTAVPDPPRRVRGAWVFALRLLWPLLLPHLWIGVWLATGFLRPAGPPLVLALFWNGVLGAFLYGSWWPPVRTRLLVKYGRATPGAVTSTRSQMGRSTTYHATFRFVDPATKRQVEQEMRVRERDHATAQARQRDRAPVTVLFDPRRPRRAVVYELCGEQVLGDEAR